jgi:hypothetical protein
MKISVRPFWLPKAGNTEDEYEDAFWPSGPVDAAAGQFRLAVADGASTTSFSGLWARLLVDAYGTEAIGSRDLDSDLRPLREEWLATITAKNLPWHAEMKVQRGAFSTLLGLSLEAEGEEPQGRWASIAVGDSCLVHMRRGTVRLTFPLAFSEEFQADPYLISSKPTPNPVPNDSMPRIEDVWEAGDVFYLMTDALACWFIRAIEENGEPWSLFEQLVMSDEGVQFAGIVEALRENKSLRNDDVTLIRVAVSA